MRQPTLVLILESHRRFAERVRLLLAVDESIQIVGSTSSAEKALALAARYRPDVFLVDLDIRGVDYVEVIRGFREMQPEARVLVMSASGERGAIRRAMNAGASGSIRKARVAATLSNVIERSDGKIAPRDGLRGHRLERWDRAGPVRADPPPALPALMTSRELEVLELLAQGRSTQEVADTLGVSVLTIRGHVRRVLVKLGVHSRLEAVAFALRRGLIQTD